MVVYIFIIKIMKIINKNHIFIKDFFILFITLILSIKVLKT